jgi:LPXTG-motif cell wall-anchored protein
MNGNDCIDDLNLMPGEYILTETHAPDGYLQIEPITFKIEGAKDLDDITKFKVNVTTTNETIQNTFDIKTGEFIVPNTSGVVLPATGGPGTRLFTILGSILIAGAGVLLWRRRRLI